MRIWIEFAIEEPLRYLSHLDTMRLWQRAIRRAALPVAYSQGFNPHPKMSFAAALPVGVISDAQYLDINFTRAINEDDILNLQQLLPAGFPLRSWRNVPEKVPALMSLVRAAYWVQTIAEEPEVVQAKIKQLLAASTVMIERKGKKGYKAINIRPFIYNLTVDWQTQKIAMLLAAGGDGSAKPQEVLPLLSLRTNRSLSQTEILLGVNGSLQSPMAVCLQEKEVSLNAEKDYYQL